MIKNNNKSYLIVITTLFTFYFNIQISLAINKVEQGIRYIKLANSYRENEDYTNALKYIALGQKLVGNKTYWNATAKEYYGYIYRDMANQETDPQNKSGLRNTAIQNFEEAESLFKKEMKSSGSSKIIPEIKAKISQIDIQKKSLKNISNLPSKATNNCSVINFDNQKLNFLPKFDLNCVENLSLTNNKLNTFPSDFSKMPHLKILSLGHNKIKEINSFGNNQAIEVIDLSDNSIKNIGEDISNLQSLRILKLSNNKLKSIPRDLIKLQNLELLDLRGNKIPFSDISDLIRSMPHTNILHNKYVPEENSETGAEDEVDSTE